MDQLQTLNEQVRSVDPDQIALPILRKLVRDIQTKSTDEVRRNAQFWEDGTWRQWREHTSHNPW